MVKLPSAQPARPGAQPRRDGQAHGSEAQKPCRPLPYGLLHVLLLTRFPALLLALLTPALSRPAWNLLLREAFLS